MLLDAAAFAPTNPLDLRVHKPDLMCLSFYKIFGYPTGMGALIIRSSLVKHLHKRYFGGGSVALGTKKKKKKKM